MVASLAGDAATVSSLELRNRKRNVVPRPASDWISTRPPSALVAARSAAIPTPRPDRLPTCTRVDTPSA